MEQRKIRPSGKMESCLWFEKSACNFFLYGVEYCNGKTNVREEKTVRENGQGEHVRRSLS